MAQRRRIEIILTTAIIASKCGSKLARVTTPSCRSKRLWNSSYLASNSTKWLCIWILFCTILQVQPLEPNIKEFVTSKTRAYLLTNFCDHRLNISGFLDSHCITCTSYSRYDKWKKQRAKDCRTWQLKTEYKETKVLSVVTALNLHLNRKSAVNTYPRTKWNYPTPTK